jgi:hypothetical protein
MTINVLIAEKIRGRLWACPSQPGAKRRRRIALVCCCAT